MSEETVNTNVVETEAPKKAVSELKAEPVKVEAAKSAKPVGIVVDGDLDESTYSNTNYFYPYLRQTYNVLTVNPQAVGYGSQNLGGFVYQNGQYNTTQRGF